MESEHRKAKKISNKELHTLTPQKVFNNCNIVTRTSFEMNKEYIKRVVGRYNFKEENLGRLMSYTEFFK